MAARRRRGEDGISFEHRALPRPRTPPAPPGALARRDHLGYNSDGKRARLKVSGKPRAAVVDKLRDLYTDLRPLRPVITTGAEIMDEVFERS